VSGNRVVSRHPFSIFYQIPDLTPLRASQRSIRDILPTASSFRRARSALDRRSIGARSGEDRAKDLGKSSAPSSQNQRDLLYLLLRVWARSGSIDWHPFFLNGPRWSCASLAGVNCIGASAAPTATTMGSGRRGKPHISALSRRRDAVARPFYTTVRTILLQ